MREGCACGAWIRGPRREVRAWRDRHHCHRPDDPPVPPSGAQSDTERAWQDTEGQISLRWTAR